MVVVQRCQAEVADLDELAPEGDAGGKADGPTEVRKPNSLINTYIYIYT